jgi:hypothetical protein
MPGALGLGNFEGAYYQYTGSIGGNSTTMITQVAYGGQSISVSGKNYSYYQPLNNYYNGGAGAPTRFLRLRLSVQRRLWRSLGHAARPLPQHGRRRHDLANRGHGDHASHGPSRMVA